MPAFLASAIGIDSMASANFSTASCSLPESDCIHVLNFVENPKQKTKFIDIITRSVTGKTSAKVFERLNQDKSPDVILFKPRAIYSLDPEEYSGRALVLDTDGETVSLLGI
ncbi:MAG: hypothetical protein ACREAE_09145 [Nitrosopumilaceae archaeon]